MMYDESVVDVVRQALMITLKVAAPILACGIVIGLVVSILQTVTSIQDQTLALVPKIAGMAGVAVLLLPWIAHRLLEFAVEMFALL
jgi:flagellar biosynthetic protein FliQ